MNIEQIAHAKAEEVVTYLRDQEDVPEVKCFDIILILAIASFILEFISFMRKKKKDSKKALAIMQKPGIVQKWELRRQLRRKLGDKYRDLQPKILNGLQYVATKTSEIEIEQMYKELPNV